ncbi:GIY-YIG nuclease family protein [Candidatus Omnitrophota bacterium]
MWYVYIIRCKGDKLYTGITKDLERRLSEHNSGEGARFTRSRLPVKLIYRERRPDRSKALKREAEIKNLTREKKIALIASFEPCQ